jgi:flagellar biosynthesis/type III secretory pathway protein FliH
MGYEKGQSEVHEKSFQLGVETGYSEGYGDALIDYGIITY